ncbi:MAG: GNAT family N-acetyltransferase [Patescibacteria group bacterium]
MVDIRNVTRDDLPVVAEMMHEALDPYYGGDHRAHAKRIVETAAEGSADTKGHFSAAQIMYVAEEEGQIIGLLNFVVKHQGTLKVSPLIVLEAARGKGVGRLLLQKMEAYAKEYGIRQIYCTVAAQNKLALSYFLGHGFIRAGMAHGHYRPNADECMLYKVVEHGPLPEERLISVLPMIDDEKPQVRAFVKARLAPYFEGVDDRWMDALFAGYARKDSRDPNEKYKIIWVAKASDGTVLGVAAATPKKGEPIKLMPLVAEDIRAFSALVAELPGLLREYGHKLYTHTVPTSVEAETLQHHGWQVEAMMPEAYKCGVVTQQWGLALEEKVMKTMRVKRQYFDAIMAGTKPIEARVGYDNIRRIQGGDNIQLECGRLSGVVQVVDVRVYRTFEEMLQTENARNIVPDNPVGALEVLQHIYPPEKEKLGVYVFELMVLRGPVSR